MLDAPQNEIPFAPPLEVPEAPHIGAKAGLNETQQKELDQILAKVSELQSMIAVLEKQNKGKELEAAKNQLKELFNHYDKLYAQAQRQKIFPLRQKIASLTASIDEIKKCKDERLAELNKQKKVLHNDQQNYLAQRQEFDKLEGCENMIDEINGKLKNIPEKISHLEEEIARVNKHFLSDMETVEQQIQVLKKALFAAEQEMIPLKIFRDAIPAPSRHKVLNPEQNQPKKELDIEACIQRGILKGILIDNLKKFITLEDDQDSIIDNSSMIRKYYEFCRKGFDETVILGIAWGAITRPNGVYCTTHIKPLQDAIFNPKREALLLSKLKELYAIFPDLKPAQHDSHSPIEGLKNLLQSANRPNPPRAQQAFRVPPIHVPQPKAEFHKPKALPDKPALQQMVPLRAKRVALIDQIEVERQRKFEEQRKIGVIAPFKRGADKEKMQLEQLKELELSADKAVQHEMPFDIAAGCLLKDLNDKFDRGELTPLVIAHLKRINLRLNQIVPDSPIKVGSPLLEQLQRMTESLEKLKAELREAKAEASLANNPTNILRSKGLAGFDEAVKRYKELNAGKKPSYEQMNAWAQGAIPAREVVAYRAKMKLVR